MPSGVHPSDRICVVLPGEPESQVAALRRATLSLRKSVMIAALKQMPVAMRGHPFGASEMTLPGAPRPLGFTGRIDVQHDAGHFVPIRTFGVGIEQTQIRDEMFVVIGGQTVGHRGLVGNRGIEWRLGHDRVRLCFPYEGSRPSQGFLEQA
jgi:hypothetical protein